MGEEKIIRYIGIDFGTSTSVVAYMDYKVIGKDENGNEKLEPDGADTKLIKDVNNLYTIPSIIITPDGNNLKEHVFGYRAQTMMDNFSNNVVRNFKVGLVNPDSVVRDKSAELTKLYFKFLRKLYLDQMTSTNSTVCIEEHTLVSYPVKWSKDAKDITKNAARDAGFRNVEGIDEANAAMIYCLTTTTQKLNQVKEFIKANRELNLLLIDMGAGTTDLSLCRCISKGKDLPEVKPLCSWPPVDQGDKFFGGKEVDGYLYKYLEKTLNISLKELAQMVDSSEEQILNEIKLWKEESISPRINDNMMVEKLPPFLMQSQFVAKYKTNKINREGFGDIIKDYISIFPELVNGILKEAKVNGSDIDVVIITGGHSQWYFIEEILQGKWVPGLPNKYSGSSGVNLNKISKEPWRVVTTPHPQEVVARGLAMYGRLKIDEMLSSNNLWIRVKVGSSTEQTDLLVKKGEPLPTTAPCLMVIDGNILPGQNINVKITPMEGTTEKSALIEKSTYLTIRRSGWNKFWESVGSIFNGSNHITTNNIFWMLAYVDKESSIMGYGLVYSSQGKGQGMEFFAINAPEPDDEIKTSLVKYLGEVIDEADKS